MALKSSGGASSSSSRPWWKYDVFVSFRGEDTRRNFTDHLSTALDQKGIITFRDDQKLERGKPISPELLKAIEDSRFSIIVFSRNYATSSWCLDELAKIVECMKEIGQTIVPIFYDVNPNEVGNQSGSFGEAFDKHEEAFEAVKVEKWRAALTEVAKLPGWDLQERQEATVIQEIVEEIWTQLGRKFSSTTVAKDLVGIDSRLQKLNSCLDIGSKDVRIIGICGMGGIGKTTLARLIYDRYSYQFEGSSFVANIREVSEKFGIATLQELLFSQALVEKNINKWDVHKGIFWNRLRNKRVFIVLDDVDGLEQLETLAGQHEWFAPGSRIIVTARDEHLLIAYGVDVIYKAESLNGEEALQLFSLKAFKQNHPKENYVELTKNIVSYATGLPLALVVLGSSLRGKSVDEWEIALKTLRETPNMDIIDILKISYNGLEETEKSIFLDVSCFYIFKHLDRVIEQLKACDLYPEIGLSVLIDKSLVSIDNNRPYVHSLLQEMARTIIRQQSPEPGRRSRVWLYDDIFHVLTNKTGTEATEVIYRNPYESKVISVDADAFSRMNNLRLLKIHDVHLPKGLDSLPKELRVLKWYGYPQKSLPSSFKAEKLIELDMPHSGIELLWNGVVHLDKLKIIKLSHAHKLTRIPDFSGVPNLERLILEGCKNLYQVHPSVGDLKRLTLLNLKDCVNLQNLPKISGWRSLKFFLLLGCSKIDKLPENLGDFEYLEELDAGQTAITEAPPSIVHLKNLKKLSFRGCKGQPRRPWNWFRSLLPMAAPSSSTKFSLPRLVGLLSLKELDLSDCNLSEGVLPSDLGQLSALKKLNLSKNDFITLPASINQLSKLQTLELADCKNLQALPELPASIEDLRTYNCSSLETLAAPLGLSTSKSREFSLNNCFRLGDNQGDDNVALSLLKHHILLLVKMRMISIFSTFMNFCENQGNNNAQLAMITTLVRVLMNALLQGLYNSPPEMPKLVVFLSGSEIPDWFMFQTTSCSLNIELPTNWYNDYTFLGLAICATFEVQDQHGQDQTKDLQRLPVPTLFRVKNASNYDYKLKFYLLSDEGNFIIFGKEYYLNRDTLDLKNHLWLLFLPFDEYFQKKNWSRVEAYIRVEGPGFEFKKCGIRFVHLQDEMGELSRAMFQGFSESQLQVLTIQLSNILSLGTTLSGPATEQSHEAQQYCENDQAGPSGSGSFPDHDQAEASDEVGAGGIGSYDEETQGAELREEAIDPMVELKGKRIQQ